MTRAGRKIQTEAAAFNPEKLIGRPRPRSSGDHRAAELIRYYCVITILYNKII